MAAVFNVFSSFVRSFTTLYWISASQSESEPELDHDFVRSFLFLKVYMFSDTLFYVHVRKTSVFKKLRSNDFDREMRVAVCDDSNNFFPQNRI